MKITDERLERIASGNAWILMAEAAPMAKEVLELRAEVTKLRGDVERYKNAISLHNSAYAMVCNAHRLTGRCDAYTGLGLTCPDCPLDDQLTEEDIDELTKNIDAARGAT